MRWVGAVLVALLESPAAAPAEEPVAPQGPPPLALHHYRPERRIPPSLEPVLRHLRAGTDEFPEEKDAEELAVRLDELGRWLRTRRAGEAAESLLAADFKGARLLAAEETAVAKGPSFEVFRSRAMPQALDRDRAAFGADLEGLVAGIEQVRVAEFLITSIVVERTPAVRAHTVVRFDIVGSVGESGLLQRTGRWRIDWRREPDGRWRITEWAALDQSRSRAASPVFVEVTEAALAGSPSFRQQLSRGLDS
jgi:hypothetical protein